MEDLPLFGFYFKGVSFSFHKKFQFYVEFLETMPYEANGEIPMIFVRMGFFEIIFENLRLYSYLYKRKYGSNL